MTIPITFTITSCNRIDLLEKTLNSFTSINNYEIDEFIMSDDSGNEKISNVLIIYLVVQKMNLFFIVKMIGCSTQTLI